MTAPVAVLDACVLYSAALRDLFMWLANAGLYVPKWTDRIHDEWMEHLLENRPDLSRERLERTRALMNAHAEGSLVEGYEGLIATLSLPDEDDRHVLAAAIACEASVIVTFNLSDFPEEALRPYEIAAQHPDTFLSSLFDQMPEAFLNTTQKLVSELKNPPRTPAQHLAVLRAQGLPETAACLEAAFQAPPEPE